MSSNIERFQKNHPNGTRVRFLGEVAPDHTLKFMEEIDILVAPSLWPENQPLSILEAMGAGKAVITTNTGGIPEIVEHDSTGHLLREVNTESILQAMTRYILSPSLAIRHGAIARERSLTWTMAATAAELAECYRELLSASSDLNSQHRESSAQTFLS